jgi:hypothetical protein
MLRTTPKVAPNVKPRTAFPGMFARIRFQRPPKARSPAENPTHATAPARPVPINPRKRLSKFFNDLTVLSVPPPYRTIK